MTPRDRAVEIVNEGIVNHEWLTDAIERAIANAVAENNEGWLATTKLNIENEREECAQILEIEARKYESGNLELIERKVAELLLILAIKIRARSESRNWSYEIQTDATFP
jgi:hypothetical protein